MRLVSDICLNGPPEKLDRTVYSHPAIVVTSLAGMAIHEYNTDSNFDVRQVAGFSLGEFSALIYSGAISLESGLELIKIRAEAIDGAVNETPGAMVSVTGLNDDKLSQLVDLAVSSTCSSGDDIQVASRLFPGGRILAGNKQICQWFVDNAKEHGAKGAKLLPVAGAFHSKCMQSAQEKLAEALRDIPIQLPTDCVIYNNVTGEPYRSPDEIRRNLPLQLVSTIHWQETMQQICHVGLEGYVEPGPGQQLKAMLKRIDSDQAELVINIKDK